MLIGHKELIRDFKKLAERGELAHGYIFFGSPRVGKATFALSLAHYLETGDFSWPKDSVPPLGDLLHMKPNAGERTMGIDQVREIRSFLVQAPNRSPLRTVVLDCAELLTTEAENALLKIAEEPSLRALIILVIDDPERLLPTLRSRLQKIYFGPVAEQEISQWLSDEHKVAATKAARAAKDAHGIPGLAWTLACDTTFEGVQKNVQEFLSLSGFARNTFIKELVDDESFHLAEFLDLLTLKFASDPAHAQKNPELWHRLMDLRRNEDYFNLNPRLQLTALAKYL